MSEVSAKTALPTQALRGKNPCGTRITGPWLAMVQPADTPAVAGFTGPQMRLQVGRTGQEAPGRIRLLAAGRDADIELIEVALSGTPIRGPA